jgi:hypothetical protein
MDGPQELAGIASFELYQWEWRCLYAVTWSCGLNSRAAYPYTSIGSFILKPGVQHGHKARWDFNDA